MSHHYPGTMLRNFSIARYSFGGQRVCDCIYEVLFHLESIAVAMAKCSSALAACPNCHCTAVNAAWASATPKMVSKSILTPRTTLEITGTAVCVQVHIMLAGFATVYSAVTQCSSTLQKFWAIAWPAAKPVQFDTHHSLGKAPTLHKLEHLQL